MPSAPRWRPCRSIRGQSWGGCRHERRAYPLHHTGKDEERGARGSSALRAAVDTEILVSSSRSITSQKQRDMVAPEPLHFKLRSVRLGQDEDGEPITSAVVEQTDKPLPIRKPLTGKNQVAMSALTDALRDYGRTGMGGEYPASCPVVAVEHWRDACAAHGLTTGASESAARTAFMRAKTKLIDMDGAAVLDAMAGGDLTPDEAGRVMAVLTAHKAIVTLGELEERIVALEGTKK